MGQVLHGSATTTHAIRAAIQRSKATAKELSERYRRMGSSPRFSALSALAHLCFFLFLYLMFILAFLCCFCNGTMVLFGRSGALAKQSIVFAPNESPKQAIDAYIMSAIFLMRPFRFCVLRVTIHRRPIIVGHYTINCLCMSSVFALLFISDFS
jgi:hypothetical protein